MGVMDVVRLAILVLVAGFVAVIVEVSRMGIGAQEDVVGLVIVVFVVVFVPLVLRIVVVIGKEEFRCVLVASSLAVVLAVVVMATALTVEIFMVFMVVIAGKVSVVGTVVA